MVGCWRNRKVNFPSDCLMDVCVGKQSRTHTSLLDTGFPCYLVSLVTECAILTQRSMNQIYACSI